MGNNLRKTSPRWRREQWIQAHESTYHFKSGGEALKELNSEENTQFGNLLTRQTIDQELLVGFLNIHSLPILIKYGKNFDLSYLIIDNKFYYIGLVDTGRHWSSLSEDDIIPQISRNHFMSQ